MKITSLESQKKNRDRLNLYIDGSFRCGLDIGTAARLGLYEGREVTEADIASLDDEEEYQKCMNTALGLASRRMQSEKEYWQKLGKKYEKPLIGRCLDRLRVLGYADDELFTENWVRERSKNRGNTLLRSELMIKGIDKSIIDKALTDRNTETDLEIAIGLGRHKYNANLDRQHNYARISGLLSRKGYSYETIRDATQEILKETAD